MRVKVGAMVLEVVSVLRKSVERVLGSQTEVILLEIVLGDNLLRIPFLSVNFIFNAFVVNYLRV